MRCRKPIYLNDGGFVVATIACVTGERRGGWFGVLVWRAVWRQNKNAALRRHFKGIAARWLVWLVDAACLTGPGRLGLFVLAGAGHAERFAVRAETGATGLWWYGGLAGLRCGEWCLDLLW